MGYDVTYHPISREEMFEWYFEPLRDDAAIDRLADKYGFLAENYRYFFNDVRRHLAESEDETFEQTHGLMLAAAQGLFRRYDYFRGSLFTNFVGEHPEYEKYVQSFREIVPEEMRSMKFSGGIMENWCGGVYIPPEAVPVLLRDVDEDPKVRNDLLEQFGDDKDLESFLGLLRYAEENRLGVLEATEVVFPFGGSTMTDLSNAELGFTDSNKKNVHPFLTTPIPKKDLTEHRASYVLDAELGVHEHPQGQRIEQKFPVTSVIGIRKQRKTLQEADTDELLLTIKTDPKNKWHVLGPARSYETLFLACCFLFGATVIFPIIVKPILLLITCPILLLCLIGMAVYLSIFKPEPDKRFVLKIPPSPLAFSRSSHVSILLSGQLTLNRLKLTLLCEGPNIGDDGKTINRERQTLYREILLDSNEIINLPQGNTVEIGQMSFCPKELPSIKNQRWQVSWKFVLEAGNKQRGWTQEYPFVVRVQ